MRIKHVLCFVAALAFTASTFAENFSGVKKLRPRVEGQAGGQVTPPGPVNTTMEPANNCDAPHAAGILASSGGVLSGDTYLAGNDFEDAWGNCSYSCNYDGWGCNPDTGDSGMDEVWEFQVEANGRWTFDTCTIPAQWDTSLGLYQDVFGFCPGVAMVCDGDSCPLGCDCDPAAPELGCCESVIADVCLAAGRTYWIVVDGWSPASWFSGAAYDLTYEQTVPTCVTNADCDDGDLCNGLEVCEDGCCVEGEAYCERWEFCDPDLQECFNLYDPCISWASTEELPGSFSPQCANSCPGGGHADDIQLHPGNGHELIGYQTYTQARNLIGAYDGCLTAEALDTLYSSYSELMTSMTGDLTADPATGCLPEAVIAGTECSCPDVGLVMPSGSGADICICEPAGGMPTGIMLPEGDESYTAGNCGVDFYVNILPGNSGSGPSLASAEQYLGGPALDDEYGQSVVMFEDCDVVGDTGVPVGTWGAGAFGAPTVSDWRGVLVCTVPSGPCCYPGGGCGTETDASCAAAGGTMIAISDPSNVQTCDMYDDDGDGVYGPCDNCPDVSNVNQRDCNDDGEGDLCDPDAGEQDADNDGCCDNVDECPTDPGKCEEGQCGCFVPEIDTDGDGCMDCVDLCPFSDIKCEPGICGCDVPDEGDADGDGVLDCVDECPGVDDAIFAPGCQQAIPTVSEWGLVVLALLLLVAGKVYFGRRRATA